MAITLSRPNSRVLGGEAIENANHVQHGEVSEDEGGEIGEANGIKANFGVVGKNPLWTRSIQHELAQLGW